MRAVPTGTRGSFTLLVSPEHLANRFKDADAARAEAQRIRDELRAERLKIDEERKAILDEARRDASAYREAEKSRIAAEIQADRERVRRELAAARDQATQELWSKMVMLATDVSTEALGGGLPEDAQRRLVEDAIKRLGDGDGHKGAALA